MRSEHEQASIPTDVARSAEPASAPSSATEGQLPQASATAAGPAVVEEVLIEEVSIDGMCGVY